MADEELAGALPAQDGGVAPVDPGDPVVDHGEAQPPKTVEDFARERGWKPKEEFSGNADDWRPAEDFIAFGMDRNKNLISDVKHLRDTTERMARTTAELTAQAVERARSEERARLEDIHRRAVEEGDQPTAFQAMQKVAELSQPASVQAPSGPPPEVQSWVQRNTWFNSDPLANARAIEVAERLKHLPTPDQLAQVERAIRKEFPEHFPSPAKQPASVAAPGSRVAPVGGRKKGFADLPGDAQQVAREMVRKGIIKSTDAYVEQFFEQGAA